MIREGMGDSYFEDRVLVYLKKDFKSREPSPKSQRTLTKNIFNEMWLIAPSSRTSPHEDGGR